MPFLAGPWRRWAAICVFGMLLCCGALAARAQEADEAEDDSVGGSGAATLAPPKRTPVIQLRSQDSWLLEICALSLLGMFLVNLFVGRRRNEQLALAWTTELVAPDGVLDRNFSLLGPGDTAAGEVLLKDSAHCYKFWASGRRFTHGLLATLNLVHRQDLLAYSVAVVKWQQDEMELEVRMSEGSMPPLVLAIAPPATARSMLADCPDIKMLCKRVEPTRDRIANWPDKLHVLAEHSSIFYDLMTPQLLDLAFGQEAFPAIRPYFRFLHVTSDLPEGDGPHRCVVRLAFALPPPGDTETLNKFLVAALLLADLLGSYKLSPEQQKRASAGRQKAEADARREAGRADDLQRRAEERRLAKFEAEKERLRKLAPEQRAKEMEKKQKLQMKRALSKHSKKM